MPQLIQILHQTPNLIAVNKPAGMLVHRTWLDRHETQFLMQTLRDQIGQHVFPVHRLDRPTSGVMLFALNRETAHALSQQFEQHQIHKTYWAIVCGWTDPSGTIDHPLKEQLDDIADRHANPDKAAQSAITHYQTLAQTEQPFSSNKKFPTSRYSWLALHPQTGRKHQLRRHLKHIFHPIIGDTTHGDLKQNKAVQQFCGNTRLLLHARSLTFLQPENQQIIEITAPVDEQWAQVQHAFGWQTIEPQP
ncbi:tRNA pseudouridine(65) synthase TruC [Kingella negevensis]|uniref:tRNA pseudouridine synthase C n=1 Tax=Kingella negevensis TaxID=1522312 RepID=A0A238HF23_9NEIS|nr:tRNA pseudouridine(65) synthase TruC [Kingella negevensis]MDK4683660.1 tRNA pseudouridine(65) synthase TruC [Kingella negevensis]MDK4697693.1 tRNA pseudouridine(65) synthase TruC [Kingella negevensis]MDK4708445.1 tRNA pseudouridine(65) synthase TruC [Kingella negevensis]MDK4710894.1 tRNA pseudouridine(65) synthase TruC [Kingella negevensis]WII92916.1 tRNA pseudouridine(65) synthase TruC [Kingella negevensis]